MSRIAVQALCMESSQRLRAVIAAWMKEAIRAATMRRIRSLAVEPQRETFVLKGCCDEFYLRKDAIDAAKLILGEALDKELITDASLTDLIEVC